MRVVRKPEHDHQAAKSTTGRLVTDEAMLRDMGWALEDDNFCATCGLCEWDGRWPVCPECCQCPDCGHDDDCPESEPHQGRGGGDE